MIDPFNITRRIFQNQPWFVSIMATQGGYVNLDWSQYEAKVALVRVLGQSDSCTPYKLGTPVLSQDAPILSTENTKATFVFVPADTASLQLGENTYRWFCEYTPAGSGASASAILCGGPALVYDSPAWGSL